MKFVKNSHFCEYFQSFDFLLKNNFSFFKVLFVIKFDVKIFLQNVVLSQK